MPKTKYADNLVVLKCSSCGNRNYYTRKNKKTVERKIELKKFCKHCRKQTAHKEGRLTGK